VGGTVETVQLDAFDQRAVERHAEEVAAKAGGIDIALNAVSVMQGFNPARPENMQRTDVRFTCTPHTRSFIWLRSNGLSFSGGAPLDRESSRADSSFQKRHDLVGAKRRQAHPRCSCTGLFTETTR
jgi:hypothetical protein